MQGYGDTRVKMLTSLRKKMADHSSSHGHKQAVQIVKEQNSGQLPKGLEKSNNQYIETTTRVLKSAYLIAKKARPFTDHPDLVQLQELNGINMGRILHSDVTCSDIIQHISTEMRKKLVKAIVSSKKPISIMLDESASLSKKSCLIVYVRGTPSDVTVSIFLDLVELESGTDIGVKTALIALLEKHGMSRDHVRILVRLDH